IEPEPGRRHTWRRDNQPDLLGAAILAAQPGRQWVRITNGDKVNAQPLSQPNEVESDLVRAFPTMGGDVIAALNHSLHCSYGASDQSMTSLIVYINRLELRTRLRPLRQSPRLFNAGLNE